MGAHTTLNKTHIDLDWNLVGVQETNSLWTRKTTDEVSGKRRRVTLKLTKILWYRCKLKQKTQAGRRKDQKECRYTVRSSISLASYFILKHQTLSSFLTKTYRGPALVNQHDKKKTEKKEKNLEIWDHARDMGQALNPLANRSRRGVLLSIDSYQKQTCQPPSGNLSRFVVTLVFVFFILSLNRLSRFSFFLFKMDRAWA